jgi:hypothetical protein
MKRFLGLALLVFVGTVGWRIGASLSSDALSMAVGVLFGAMAGIPAALLVLASGRRREPLNERNGYRVSYANAYANGGRGPLAHPYLPQPPVIVVTPPSPAAQPGGGAGPGSGQPPMGRPIRQFTVVGGQDELVEDW